MSTDSLNAYAGALDKALKNQTAFTNFNKDIQHATVIVCMAFRHAENRIRLLSQKLDPVLYGGKWFKDEAEDFLKRGGRLDILVESDVDPTHPVMDLMKGERRSQVSMKRVPDTSRSGYTFNFMLVDDIGFRFEHDRNNYEALVMFNEPKNTDLKNSLESWFSHLSEQSDKQPSNTAP